MTRLSKTESGDGIGLGVEEISFSPDAGVGLDAPVPIQYDRGAYPYLPPQWVRGRAPQNPVAYTLAGRSSKLSLSARFTGGVAGADCVLEGFAQVIPNPGQPDPPKTTDLATTMRVILDAEGSTPPLSFEVADALPETVFAGRFSLKWYATIQGKRSPVGVTENPLYMLLDQPTAPWGSEDTVAQSIPWQTALDVACDWAHGAKTEEEAVELITTRVNSGGEHRYSPGSWYGTSKFYLTNYLTNLKNSSIHPLWVNCADCAAIVRTFSNLLGLSCRAEKLSGADCTTRPITLVGEAACRSEEWSFHEFCMRGADGSAGRVDDACLRLEGATDSPVGMPFDGAQGYLRSLMEHDCSTLRRAPARGVS